MYIQKCKGFFYNQLFLTLVEMRHLPILARPIANEVVHNAQ